MTQRMPSRGDDRGQILILTAFAMLGLIGMAALTLDASFMYDKRNRLWAAADAAAKSGAIEVKRTSSPSSTNPPLASLEAFADQAVQAHGFNPTRLGGTTTVTVNHPPTSGPWAGDVNFVEVYTSEPTTTFVGFVWGLLSMTPGARAVAGSASGNPCIITLAPPGSSPISFSLGSSSQLIMPGCTVEVGGNLNVQSSGEILADGTSVTGTCSGTGGGCTHVTNMSTNTGIPPTDPLSGLVFPADPGGCTSITLPGGGTPSTINPGCYTYIDATTTGLNLTMNPGLYYFKGAFDIGHNALINGSGLLFAMAGTASPGPCLASSTAGCFRVGNNAEMHLSAQTSGPYNGILMFGEPSNQTDVTFNGNAPIYDMSGAMYFPTAHVDFRNGISTTNDCTLIVAYSMQIEHGNGTLDNTCSAYGGSPILTVAMAE